MGYRSWGCESRDEVKRKTKEKLEAQSGYLIRPINSSAQLYAAIRQLITMSA